MRIHVLLIAALGVTASAGLAQDADVGRALFHRHCATCHGLEGRGDGPMAGAMLIKPANLTELSITNQGVFPLERVVRRIDGRDPLISHGSPMPVYGDYFERVFDVPIKTPAGQPVLTSRPVVDLVAYLNEIQRQE
ncbi:cytochrome C [Salipiger aestuarii]|uniref:Cytochrome c n=1 Tax=Salipiger aestuarii TaxID=568098 RepID=A0A327Y7U5_9RHOB|nr:c-type cytochrome [Salipiger aestuarii]KAA8608145.1 cytochrome C [Salipiger aestuarii]KAB2542033.1 cytochrome C [Salipiger aestuarii]RAK16531.1 cytochrome c [Salipiger aestuarii]